MMSFWFLCTVALASLQDGGRAASLPVLDVMDDNDQMDNSLEPNAGVQFSPRRHSWLKINGSPPKVLRRESGSRVELECEAHGSPAPVLTWLRDQEPITQSEDYENNQIIEGSEEGRATVRSRLIINNYQPSGKNIYTCLAKAGPETDYASTVVITTQHMGRVSSPAEYVLMNQQVLQTPTKPRIVLFYQTIMETIGTTVVLPCKAVGYPKPEIYWIYNENSIITDEDPRIKVMRSGELVIEGLRWSDMGQYTCVARNFQGKDTIETFIYPVLSDK